MKKNNRLMMGGSLKMICGLLFLLMLSLNFYGCSSSSDSISSTKDNSLVLSGTASEGAVIAGQKVTLKDANGTTKEGTTDANGVYSFDVTSLTAPFILEITGTNGTYVSFAQDAGTANINPITTMVLVLATGDPDVSALFTDSDLNSIKANYEAKADLVTESLETALSGYNAENYFTGTITPGEGMDALFDTLLITFNATDGISVITKDDDSTVLIISADTVKNNTDDQLPKIICVISKYLHYTLPNQYLYGQNGGIVADEAAALFSSYTLTNGIDYDGNGTTVEGYKLDQFIDKDVVNGATPDPDGVLGANDARNLYSVVIRSNQDGFTNRTKFYDNGTKTEVYNSDLRWDQFEKGYLLDLNYSGKTHFETTVSATPEFPKMFNVKYAYDMYMFRKIDVKRPDAAGTIATFEVQATTDNYVDDTNFKDSNGGLETTKFNVQTISFGAYTNVKAISLDQFITDYVTDLPGSYTYKIVSLDGTSKEGWTYAQVQQAYYLPDFDFIVQVAGGSQVAGTKINFPVRIELVGATYEYSYAAKNPPAYAWAYDEK